MSHDIILVPRRPGQSWESALDDDTADPRGRLELQQVWSRIESRLSATLDGEIDSWSAADDDDGTTIGELSVMESGLQVELFVGQAAVSFPYWEQEDSETLHRQVTDTVRVVAEETGYAAYDPQTDQAFNGTFADEEGIAFTQQLTASHGSVDRTSATPTPTPTPIEAPPSYSGRRRAGTYLVIGLIVTLGAGTWLLSGNGGPLSWVALAIGVADLLIGARAWTSSSPPEASA